MDILIINAGSSSLKYQLIDMREEKVLAKGLCDRIGIEDSIIKHTKTGTPMVEKRVDMPDHTTAMGELIKVLTDKETGVIASMKDIGAVGHRVVHGGEKFKDSVVIDQEVMAAIEDCIELAPLHNPANITGIKACKRVMPGTPNVAVFDTAFHQSIPKKAYTYALPYEYYTKYGIRKYGFHGTSHKYVAARAAAMLGRPLEELKLITCHLGNGASVCAIDKGKSVDTSMGFTPLAGLAMGTRSGTIDPAVIFYIMRKENLDVQQIDDLLNKRSGVLGISGVSSDFRDLHDAADAGNERAILAIDMFCYRVKKYIAEYIGVLNGCDAVIFTAGIGENNAIVRKNVLAGLENLGIEIDQAKNLARGVELDISAGSARIRTLIVPTNEELAIARETLKLI